MTWAALFGPSVPHIDPVEQVAQFRSLAALAAVFLLRKVFDECEAALAAIDGGGDGI
jgi:hypothetical protein